MVVTRDDIATRERERSLTSVRDSIELRGKVVR